MKDYIRIPKVQLTICLLLIYLTNLFFNFSLQTLLLIIIVPIVGMVSDLIFTKLKKKKFFIPSAAMTTSMIVVLLTGPQTPIYFPIFAVILAMASKVFIRPGRHIFNPASFGLIISSFLLAIPVAWWGPGNIVALSGKLPPLFLILLLPLLISGLRMKRYYTILVTFVSFILSSLLLFTVTKTPISQELIVNLLTDPTLIFFALVMAPEPMTTPYSVKNQILFGLFVGMFAVFSSRFIYEISFLKTLDPLVLSLLIGNVIFFRRK